MGKNATHWDVVVPCLLNSIAPIFNWTHLPDAMRGKSSCGSLLFIFWSPGHAHYTLEIFFLLFYFNSFYSIMLTAGTKETPPFPFYRYHPCFCQTFTWQSFSLKEPHDWSQCQTCQRTSSLKFLGSGAGTGKWFQLSNLRTNALWL